MILNTDNCTRSTKRQGTILSIFGFVSVSAAVSHFQGRWDAEYPAEPLDPVALAISLRSEMNALLPESFTLEVPDTGHITGPDMADLPSDWKSTARHAFRSKDLRHLEI